MEFKKYVVEYETAEGCGSMIVEADGYAGASTVCFYEHGDEEGYTVTAVLDYE